MREQSGSRGLFARRLVGMTVALQLAVLHAPGAPAELLDKLLAQVDGRTVAASDIALARALGALGFASSAAPIERAEVERYVDVLLFLQEAERIGISVEPAETDRAWAAAAGRVGSEASLRRWLEEHAIDPDWARHVVESDVLRSKFLGERFAAFVFPSEEEIAGVLGPGQHDETAREQARERLIRAAAEKAQAEWLDGARRRAAIRILLPDGAALAPPFASP
jgi:hypothetical protein